MNPLTNIKSRQRQREQEVLNGVPESASVHADYRSSAYIYAGQLSFNLTEGDLLAVFSEYGEVVDVNLVRYGWHAYSDKKTGKSRGFAFIAYEDQRSTDIAVDNLNGFSLSGRMISVDHVKDYKRLVENPDYVDPSAQIEEPRHDVPDPPPQVASAADPPTAMAPSAQPVSIAEMLRDVEADWRDWRKAAREETGRQDAAKDSHRIDKEVRESSKSKHKKSKHGKERGEITEANDKNRGRSRDDFSPRVGHGDRVSKSEQKRHDHRYESERYVHSSRQGRDDVSREVSDARRRTYTGTRDGRDRHRM